VNRSFCAGFVIVLLEQNCRGIYEPGWRLEDQNSGIVPASCPGLATYWAERETPWDTGDSTNQQQIGVEWTVLHMKFMEQYVEYSHCYTREHILLAKYLYKESMSKMCLGLYQCWVVFWTPPMPYLVLYLGLCIWTSGSLKRRDNGRNPATFSHVGTR